MKKMIVLIAAAVLAFPVIATADLVGDCYDCHTMHNSEQNAEVVDAGGAEGLQSLLRYDCLGCHAQNPTGGGKNWTGPGGSVIPQVAHGAQTLNAFQQFNNLSGGNFNQTTNRKIHSVVDVTSTFGSPVTLGENVRDQPPGIPHTSNRHVFTSEESSTAFDMFTCAGARGCHGTRSQIVVGGTVDNGTANNWEIDQRRTGITAITGSHHNNIDGEVKTSTGYDNILAVHDGQTVADGYRFIVGLWGYENSAREWLSDTDHNEYYGKLETANQMGGGCEACHIRDFASGENQRASFESGIVSINNSMSGFCSSCHGYFHSSGGGGAGDYVDNGSSGAFLRHPSDYTIPESGEYAAYDVHDPRAPVMRNLAGITAGPSPTVTGGTDMVGCLSCHVAHGSPQDYMLRFDYAAMTAGGYGDIAAAQARGGCLACHTEKGVLPQNRTP